MGWARLRRVIVMQPVLEIYTPDGFDLWPVAEVEPFGFLPLSGALSPAEVGTAVMRVADYNDVNGTDDASAEAASASAPLSAPFSASDSDSDSDLSPRPPDPLGSFLHGLLTCEHVIASGGLRVTDDSTGVTFQPGCCDGLEDWRDWHRLVDDDGHGLVGFGHDPVSPTAERFGDTVRLTMNMEQSDSPVIELGVSELRHLLTGVERDLTAFLALAAAWSSEHLPSHHTAVTSAIARALDLPEPTPAHS